MGRIQKKKDPDKKKAQRLEKVSSASSDNGGNAEAAGRSVQPLKKAPAAAKSKAVAPGEGGIVQKSIQFLREVKVELKKVTWPSRKQTMGSTVVVIVLVVIISMFLGVVDFSLSSVMRAVLP